MNMVLFSADVVRLRSHHVTYLLLSSIWRVYVFAEKPPIPAWDGGLFCFQLLLRALCRTLS